MGFFLLEDHLPGGDDRPQPDWIESDDDSSSGLSVDSEEEVEAMETDQLSAEQREVNGRIG